MSINIAIVEDSPSDAKILSDYLSEYFKNTDKQYTIEVFDSGIYFLDKYTPRFDIIFMDIEMPNMSGMETAKKLREIDEEVLLIFVTNMSQFALKGYEVSAFDFLVKPVTYNVFTLKMKRVVDKLNLEKDVIAINFAGGIMNLPLASIKYIETSGHAVIFHTTDEKYKTYSSLKTIEKQINSLSFFKCNSCYLVNLKYVRGVNGYDLFIGDEVLQISRARKTELVEVLNKYLGGSL